MTNEQWLKSLDTEELADILANFSICKYSPCYKYCAKEGLYGCQDTIKYWLKQEREE